MTKVVQLTGKEVLPMGDKDKRTLTIINSITLQDLVDGIISIYNDHVYCEGFPTQRAMTKFEQEAYAFIVKSFCSK